MLSRNRKIFAVSSLVLNLFASQIGEFFLPHPVDPPSDERMRLYLQNDSMHPGFGHSAKNIFLSSIPPCLWTGRGGHNTVLHVSMP